MVHGTWRNEQLQTKKLWRSSEINNIGIKYWQILSYPYINNKITIRKFSKKWIWTPQ